VPGEWPDTFSAPRSVADSSLNTPFSWFSMGCSFVVVDDVDVEGLYRRYKVLGYYM
jgi:hypothetical protein